MTSKKHDLLQRIQALTFLGMEMKIEDVGRMTEFSRSELYDVKKRAIERGYDPIITPLKYNVHIEDAKESGRPSISLKKQLKIVAKVTTDRPGELVANDIAEAFEFPSAFPIKKSTKRRTKRRSIMPI